jgi:hypothetical protein
MTSLKEGSDKGGLRGWFEGGGWDRYDSKGNKIGKCGGKKPEEAKPKCFSKEKAAALGKKGRAQAVRRKRREDPNPNRQGKPINTPSTKKGLKKRKKRESMSDFTDSIVKKLQEKTKKDACYHKVKASAKVWPSAYASGRLVQCRKKGASNYGNKRKDEEDSVTVTSDSGVSKTLTGARARRVKSKAQGHVKRGTAGPINPGKHMTSSGGRAGRGGGVEFPFGDMKINANTKIIGDAILEALKCWKGYKRVKGKTPGSPGSCTKESYKRLGDAILKEMLGSTGGAPKLPKSAQRANTTPKKKRPSFDSKGRYFHPDYLSNNSDGDAPGVAQDRADKKTLRDRPRGPVIGSRR